MSRECWATVAPSEQHLTAIARLLPTWQARSPLQCALEGSHDGDHHALVDSRTDTESLWLRWPSWADALASLVRLVDCHAMRTDPEDWCWLPADHFGGCAWERSTYP
ncbi:hypothetical protein ACZ90_10070 [Streptomyces albus subsp. albus]|nr:hypothetical protein ACZ90_10070 [Streptomyces albus subsp. albus]